MLRYDIRTGVKKIKTKSVIAISTMGLVLGGGGLSLAIFGTAHASGSDYSTFGAVTIVSGGNPGSAAQLTSDPTVAPGYGGIDFSPSSPISWSNLSTLSADFNVTDDGCGGGSPRIVLNIDTDGNGTADGDVSISLGPSPNFTGCSTNTWISTGNLIGNTDAGRYDFSHLGGSTFTTYSGAPASVMNGSVVGASIVVDGSWNSSATGGDSEQTVLVDNLNINGDITTFEPVPSMETCKNGGWSQFTNPSFKNQGQCVSYAQHTNSVGQDDVHAKSVR